MRKITFKDGTVVTTKLTAEEAIRRMNRLDTLKVLTQAFEEGEGLNICRKAYEAWNKNDNFTGIIHLTKNEKDFLGYCLENEYNTKEDNEVLNFYIHGGKPRTNEIER